jgi:hypothetical protein
MMMAIMEPGNALLLLIQRLLLSKSPRGGVEIMYSELSIKDNSIVHSGVISGK